MMTGFGQFGPIEMGGMFTVMKVREGLAANDYKDPGPYKNPPGTVAYEVKVAEAGEPMRQKDTGEAPGMNMPGMDMPGMKSGGNHH
jgi:manganese oxidase